MRPYYEQDGIVIYHGDCREVLLEVDLAGYSVITDPVWPNASVPLAGAENPEKLLRQALLCAGDAQRVAIHLGNYILDSLDCLCHNSSHVDDDDGLRLRQKQG